MDNMITARTALSDVQPVNSSHTLAEAALSGKINLRGNANDPAFLQSVESVLGLALPLDANTVTSTDANTVFWLGPDEWLIHLPLDEVDQVVNALRASFGDQNFALTDISDYFSVIELAGPHSRSIIASGSPFDTRVQHFSTGQCAQTQFGHASILLWPLDDTSGFGLQVRWSYAQYVFEYLAQSVRNAENLNNIDPLT